MAPNLLQAILPSKRAEIRYTDLHCHILPGLDDGAGDLSVSLSIARNAVSAGAKRIVATPHFMQGVFEPSPDDIRREAGVLRARLLEEGLDLEIVDGCEVYLSDSLCEDFTQGKVLPIGGSRCLLIELPSVSLPPGAFDLLFRLRVLGAGVILAHPERNIDLRRDRSRVREMVETGFLLQVNAGSLVGVYGKDAAAFAGDLFKEGLVHFIGSDAHSGRSAALRDSGPDIRPALARAFRSQREAERFVAGAEERFEALLRGNLG